MYHNTEKNLVYEKAMGVDKGRREKVAFQISGGKI
jgi:hypothetical protein